MCKGQVTDESTEGTESGNGSESEEQRRHNSIYAPCENIINTPTPGKNVQRTSKLRAQPPATPKQNCHGQSIQTQDGR